MIGFVGNHLSREMLALLLLELLMSFGLAYILLSSGAGVGMVVAGGAHSVANNACILSLTVGVTAFAIGLYRPEVFRRTRGLLINTALGGLLAFPAAWLVSVALGMDADRLVGAGPFWPLKIVLLWIAALFAVRLSFLAAVRSNVFARPVAM
ncbi:MAG: hypothetical protein H7Z10_06585, partial [Gemmatimonadaceae bacterium]|nr:hypothetical protein [Acetobacteraceae bacterium]